MVVESSRTETYIYKGLAKTSRKNVSSLSGGERKSVVFILRCSQIFMEGFWNFRAEGTSRP